MICTSSQRKLNPAKQGFASHHHALILSHLIAALYADSFIKPLEIIVQQ